MQLLLLHGANPNQKDRSGHTAAHYATDVANVDLLKTLLERMNPDVRCADGHTPLPLRTEQIWPNPWCRPYPPVHLAGEQAYHRG